MLYLPSVYKTQKNQRPENKLPDIARQYDHRGCGGSSADDPGSLDPDLSSEGDGIGTKAAEQDGNDGQGFGSHCLYQGKKKQPAER